MFFQVFSIEEWFKNFLVDFSMINKCIYRKAGNNQNHLGFIHFTCSNGLIHRIAWFQFHVCDVLALVTEVYAFSLHCSQIIIVSGLLEIFKIHLFKFRRKTRFYALQWTSLTEIRSNHIGLALTFSVQFLTSCFHIKSY